jgi:four helix bundle protein
VLGWFQGLRSRCARRGLRPRPGASLRALDWGGCVRKWASVKEQHVVFQVEELSFQVIQALRPLIPRLKQRNRSLADQLERAATSVALNIAEGNHSDPGNRRARFFTAKGSASESLAALRAARCWGYVSAEEAENARELLTRIVAMLWKLTH